MPKVTAAHLAAEPFVVTNAQAFNPAALAQLLRDFADNAGNVITAIETLVSSGVSLNSVLAFVLANGAWLGKIMTDLQAMFAGGKMAAIGGNPLGTFDWTKVFAALLQFLMSLFGTPTP